MTLTRRSALELGLAASASAFLSANGPARAQSAQAGLSGDQFSFSTSEVIIHPVNHASLVIAINGTILYIDPVGAMSRYEGLPPPDLILVTHEHSDHYAPGVLRNLSDGTTPLIANPAVFDRLPDDLKSSSVAMANGETLDTHNLNIQTIPAYNLAADRLQFHPPGRDNGYILNIAGGRIYIAGDTEDIPEMRALKNIDIAFIPMILPWTMDEEHAASAVNEFMPDVVYPYHYGPSDIENFKALVQGAHDDIDVRFANWY